MLFGFQNLMTKLILLESIQSQNINNNDLMMKKQSRQQFDNQKTLSKGTFKTNSDPRIINAYFDHQAFESNTNNSACSFCIYKPTILNKLKVLKEIIEEKNQRIKELQSIIYNITNVALGEENQLHSQNQLTVQNRSNGFQGKEEDFQEMSFSQNKFVKQSQNKNKENNRVYKSKVANNDPSLASSQVNSQKQVKQLMNMRVQIKKEIKNMNLDVNKQIVDENKGFQKEFGLKKKLIQIINVLPKTTSRQTLIEFQTLSQPRNQGTTGLVNSKVSNHKRVKNIGFLKKRQFQDQFSQKNYTSHQQQSLKSQKWK